MIVGSDAVAALGRDPRLFAELRLPTLPSSEVLALGLEEGQIVRPAVEILGDRLRLRLEGRLIELANVPRGSAHLPQAFEVKLLPGGGAQLRPLLPASPGQPAVAGASAQASAPAGGATATVADLPSRALMLSLRPQTLASWLSLLSSPQLERVVQASGVAGASGLLAQLMPRMAALGPHALRAAFLRSGLFTEGLAAAGDRQSLPDLKSLLLAARHAPDSLKPEIGMLVDAAIDDVEASQLASIQALASETYGVDLALRFSDAPPCRLRVRREAPDPSSPEAAAAWFIEVRSHGSDWGQITLRAGLSAGTEVALRMWSDREAVCDSARARTGELSRALEQAGLRLTRFDVVHGEVSEPQPSGAVEAGRLLDLRT